MKKHLLFILLSCFICISSANAQCVKLLRDTTRISDGTNTFTTVKHYIYGTGGNLVKIETKDETGSSLYLYDTLYYMSGKLDSVVSYTMSPLPSKSQKTKNTWSGDLLVKQTSESFGTVVYKDTTEYTYSGLTLNTLSGMESASYEDGVLDGSETLTNFMWTSNNLSSASYQEDSAPAIDVTVESDSYPNPFYGLALNGDFIGFFNENNMESVYPTLTPGSPFTERTLAYQDGRLYSAYESYNAGAESQTVTYVYDCPLSILKPSSITTIASYPNPSADGKFSIDLSNFDISTLSVVSATGEVVKTMNVSPNTSTVVIDLSNEPIGIYMLQLKGGNEIISSKLVRQ